MSNITKRDRALREGRSVARRVSPETLHQLIQQRGRRTTPVSPTAFEFSSTTAQTGDVRVFMRALPRVLSR